MDEKSQRQDPEASPTNITGNGSKQSSSEDERRSEPEPITVEQSAQRAVRKYTGPRTPEGIENSKHNALRHGIFSEVTVLPGESSDEYESLLNGLLEALQPENRLENLLVEKLAMLSWRHRRLLKAEGAEIRHGSEFLEWDQKMKQQHESEIAKRTRLRIQKTFAGRPGLIPEKQNPEILEYCVELLLELQRLINCRGFAKEDDSSILEIIYGADPSVHGTLRNRYFDWLNTSQESEQDREHMAYWTPEQCKDKMLSEINVEIEHLQDYQQEQTRKESERTKLEILRRSVPEPDKLDRLLRYESSLERAFDRALNQLERMQRLRRGQPVAPRLELNLSG